MLKAIFILIIVILTVAALSGVFMGCSHRRCRAGKGGRQGADPKTGDMTFMGPTQLHDTVVNGSLTCHGPAELDDVEVHGSVRVHGVLKAEDVLVHQQLTVHGKADFDNMQCSGDLTVHGLMRLDDCRIVGTTVVHGSADLEDSDVQDLTVYSDRVRIESSKVKSIVINNMQGSATVELEEADVAGDITFHGSSGRVIMDDESSIGGNVVGGTVVSK